MTIATHPFDALMEITARPPTVFVRGEGSYLWDDAGKRYLDFIQGWAVNCLGHSPPVVAQALSAQAKLLLTPSPAYYNAVSLKLAKALVDRSCFDQVFFANSGAEANEGAIKLARKYGALHGGGAHEIITFDGGFHGRTLATMSASGKKAFEPLFEPKVPGFPKAKLNDLASVRRLISDKTIAVMLEPIQGEAGVWPATDQFLQELRALTEAHSLLLIFDEIQTGMGRTGTLFAYEQTGIVPDVMTLAKGLGGGVPIGAMLAANPAAEAFDTGSHGSTFGGNALTCAVGLAVMETLEGEGVLANCVAMGERLRAGLRQLAARHPLIKDVRGQGLLVGAALSEPGAPIVDRARAAGLIINCTANTVLRLTPPLTVSAAEVDEALAILDRVLAS